MTASPDSLEKLAKFYIDRANTMLERKDTPFKLQRGDRALGLDHEFVFTELVKYFHGYESAIPLHKGVFLAGPVGTGKSFMLEIFKANADPLPPGKPYWESRFKRYSAQQIAIDYQVHGASCLEFLRDKKQAIMIDDIGTEDVKKNYGNELNVIEYAISTRYELWEAHGTMTHYTGNSNEKQISELYGDRCLSRIKDQCKMILFAGEDKRGNES